MNKTKSPPTFDRIITGLWATALLAFAVMLLLPFRFTLLRAAIMFLPVLLWTLGAYLLRRNKVMVFAAVALPIALGVFLLLPGKQVDADALRAEYLRSLKSLRGTVYVWGGETRTGIDCSGLVRGAMTNANLREGIRTGNPALLRNAAVLWWHDESAKALGENDRALTQTLADVRSLNDAPYADLRPGDIAVMASGSHTLAYLGGKRWIQADPKAMRVVETIAPTNADGWFIQQVRLLRWTQLAPVSESRQTVAPPR